jgi:hypothetical protein
MQRNKYIPYSRKVKVLINFWLDSKNCECGPVSVGKTEVEVVSSYQPSLTKNLLTNLHIEKSKLEGKPKTLVFGPSKSG